MSDLIKSHEGNDDFHADIPNKVHWGKFNMMGRFILGTVQCQTQCRLSSEYNFPDRSNIAELFVKRPLMSEEVRFFSACVMHLTVWQLLIAATRTYGRSRFRWASNRSPESAS